MIERCIIALLVLSQLKANRNLDEDTDWFSVAITSGLETPLTKSGNGRRVKHGRRLGDRNRFLDTPVAADNGAQHDTALQAACACRPGVGRQHTRDDDRRMLHPIGWDRRVTVSAHNAAQGAAYFAADYAADNTADRTLGLAARKCCLSR
jgi:hypothetical protein